MFKQNSIIRSGWLLLTLILLSDLANAQVKSVDNCGTMHADSVMRSSIPGAPSLEQFEFWLQDKIQEYNANSATQRRAILTIPVIVHVIHNGDAVGQNENISAAQVYSQIDILNQDFRRLNPDTGNTPAVFQSVAADCEIEFCLALRDENGNVLAEPGINRVDMGSASWSSTTNIDNTLKPATIWDPDQYFNIWSVNFGSSSTLLGYAQFPEGSGLAGMPTGSEPADADGVVIRYDAFGNTGNVTSPYNGGRTATHEVGHWLGLRHIWGDGGCGVDDYCNDTPTSDDSNRGCPNVTNCSSLDMVQNYMDYTNDACMNIFTQDQKTRMMAVMANSPRRVQLLNSTVCTVLNQVVVTGQVRDANTLQGVPGAKVRFIGVGSNLDLSTTCDNNGNFIDTLYEGDYNIYAGQWGYRTVEVSNQTFISPASPVVIDIEEGYYDDFVLNFNWNTTSNASTGDWERDAPIGTDYNGDDCNPSIDVATDFGSEAFVTGNGGGAAGNDDIDGGTVTLTSPVFDLTTYNEPYLSYYRWFYNDGGSGTPDDDLTISISNGSTTVQIEQLDYNTASSNQWNFNNIRVRDFVTPTANMTFILSSSDGVTSSVGHLVEAGLDVFAVVDSQPNTNVPPIARILVGSDTICVGATVQYTDNSTNSPTSWAWSFPGGTPSTSTLQDPTVTYSAAGQYSATLIATNAFGSDTTTVTNLVTVQTASPAFTADNTTGCVGLTVQFTDQSTCGASNWTWSFPGGTPATSTQQNPVVTYSGLGSFDVTLTTNGNSVTLPSYITTSVGGAVTVLEEDFESGSFLTNGWTLADPDGSISWDIYTVGGNGPGDNAAGIELYNYNSIGQRDGLVTPVLDLSNVASTTLDFVHAYRRDNGSRQDSLLIYVSTDGGATYPNKVFTGVENGTGTFATNSTMGSAFTPAIADDWCFSGGLGASCFSVDLSAFDGNSNVRVKFESYNDSENNMYLDDITITGNCSAASLPPVADLSAADTSGCGSVQVQFQDNSLYAPTAWAWSFPGGTPATSTQQNPTVDYSSTGTYNVTLIVSNANGSDTAVYNNYIEVFADITASVNATDVSCAGGINGTVTAVGTGGSTPYTYLWSNNSSASGLGSLSPGTYPVTITDANGCTANASGTVSAPSAITVTTSSTDAYCGSASGTVTASAAGGSPSYTYNWGIAGSGATLTGLSAGTYSVTVTDDNGCTAIASATVSSGTTTPSYTQAVTNVSCNGSSDGMITITPTGATPYTYAWSNNTSSNPATGLAAGTYTVTLTDANGCSAVSSPIIVSEPQAMTITETIIDATCGNSNGSISLLVSGGAGNYTYAWSVGSNSNAALSALASGSYTVTITDTALCQLVATYSVSNTGGPSVSLSTTDVTCATSADGKASLAISGGTMPYTITWSHTASSADSVVGLTAGAYSVTVADAAGCNTIRSFNITAPNALTVNVAVTDATCGHNNGAAAAAVSGGTMPYSYAWTIAGSGNTSSVNNIAAGAYELTVTDQNNCSVVTDFNISNSSTAVLSTSSTDVTCAGAADGSVEVLINSAVTPLTYTWSNSATGSSITNVDGGIYLVTVTDGNGCDIVLQDTVVEPAALSLSFTVTDLACGNGSGGINAIVTGGTGPLTYVWNNGSSGAQLTTTMSGVYHVTVTDASGCIATGSEYVGQGTALQTSMSINADSAALGNGTATVNTLNGTAPFTYQWSNGQSSVTAINLSAGTYLVTVTDAANCSAVDTAVIPLVSGLDDVDRASTINVYPNPTSGSFVIDLRGLGHQVDIDLYNSIGQKLNDRSARGVVEMEYSMDISDLAEGVYFIRLRVGDRLLNKRVVLTHN